MGINTGWGGGGSVSITANRAAVSNGSGALAASATTATEIGYISGLSSAVQTQLNGKAASSHNHVVGDITATGTPSATTYLRGDGSWQTPSGGVTQTVVRFSGVSAKGATNAFIFQLATVDENVGSFFTVTTDTTNGGYITVASNCVLLVTVNFYNASGSPQNVLIRKHTALVNDNDLATYCLNVLSIPTGSTLGGAIAFSMTTADKLFFTSAYTPNNTYPNANKISVVRIA